MGTLYRHFPTKEELLNTVLHQDFADWTRSAGESAAGEPDPARALTHFLHDALSRQSDDRALAEGFADCWDEDVLSVCRRELHPILDDLVSRCHDAEVLRAGVTAEDISILLMGLGAIVQLARPHGREDLPARSLDIVIAGLFTPSTTPAPTRSDTCL